MSDTTDITDMNYEPDMSDLRGIPPFPKFHDASDLLQGDALEAMAQEMPDLPITPEDCRKLEKETALVLLNLEKQKAVQYLRKNPIPEQKEEARVLVDTLRDMLDCDIEGGEITQLTQQAKLLNAAFRRLLYDADITYQNSVRIDCDPMKYAAAFNAQDQYRRTIKTLKALKNNKKERVRPKKRVLKPSQATENKGKS